MKNIALLLVLVFMLSLSFVFATETITEDDILSTTSLESDSVLLTAPASDNTGADGENTTLTTGIDDPSIEGTQDDPTTTPETTPVPTTPEVTEADESFSSTIWGAVIAIVIVIAVVGLVALIQKK